MSAARQIFFAVIVTFAASSAVRAQNRGGPPPAPPTAKASAPVDLTGYWVAIVNEDWRYRMVTPAKGDFRGVPITQEALKIVNAWDPAADEKAGNQCKSYGAGAVMRLPARDPHHVAGRQHAEARDRRRHADAALPVRADAGPGRSADVAGPFGRAMGASRSRKSARCARGDR